MLSFSQVTGWLGFDGHSQLLARSWPHSMPEKAVRPLEILRKNQRVNRDRQPGLFVLCRLNKVFWKWLAISQLVVPSVISVHASHMVEISLSLGKTMLVMGCKDVMDFLFECVNKISTGFCCHIFG